MCFIVGQTEFLRSTKGGVQLVHHEFMYYRGETKGSKASWRCIDYQRLKCKALCQTVDGRVTRMSGSHDHEPHTETIRKRRQRQDAIACSMNMGRGIALGPVSFGPGVASQAQPQDWPQGLPQGLQDPSQVWHV